MVQLDFHARVQTGSIFWSNFDWETCCVSRSALGRSAVFVFIRMARVSLLLTLCTISPRDYESRTCRRGKMARVKTLFFDMAFADEAPRWKTHDQIERLDRCSGSDSSNGTAEALENVQVTFCLAHTPIALNAD